MDFEQKRLRQIIIQLIYNFFPVFQMSLILSFESLSERSNDSRTNPQKASNLEERVCYYSYQKPGLAVCQSFSPDGRVLCSPCDNYTRLLAFNEQCQEPVQCQGQGQKPQEMTELCLTEEHDDYVFAAKFSPQGHLLATGCCSGDVKFHQPVL